MTFVTVISKAIGANNVQLAARTTEPANCTRRKTRVSYSAECRSASRAFRSQMVKLRPSIFSIPSAWRRERLRETSSRTVPICDASSWLLTGRVISTPSLVRLPSFSAKRNRKDASRCRTVVNESSSIIPTRRRRRAPTTRRTLSATWGWVRHRA